MPEPDNRIPSERELYVSIERGAVASLVQDLLAEACHRGEADSSESLLVAGSVADLLDRPHETNRESVHESAPGSVLELLYTAWAFLSLLPRRELNVKWLRQLPREDRPFLYVRSLEEVLAAPTLEEASLRLSAILQAVQEPEARGALFLEAAAWTPGSSALALTQIALEASGEEAEHARPFWLRILEWIYSAGSEIPFRPPADPGPFGWAELSRSWPEDPEALLSAWISRPRWMRALDRSGTKSASVRAALVRHLDSMHRVTPMHSQPGRLQERGPVGDTPWTHWTRERETGRAQGALEGLRSGRPVPFLALAGLCAMRTVPPVIDARILEETYRALDRMP